MASLLPVLALGFLLGMRHATDADHVVAIGAIVSRERSLRGAARLGAVWGVGHTLTILLVGGAIILLEIVVPPRLGLTLELTVAAMLIVLGGLNLRQGAWRANAPHGHPHLHADLAEALLDRRLGARAAAGALRPLLIGVVHGLAGSAAVALLVLGTLRDPRWAAAYLLVFGGGTVIGMTMITVALALPLAAAARRFADVNRYLAVSAGLLSVAFGLFLVYQIGFVDGLFTAHPRWTPG
jgi:hypothetical protein